MDLLTQVVLGAAVGEVVLGKKAGNKAIVWGAVGGLIPDLDVLIVPLFSEVDGLFVHRGLTHSLLFAFVIAPLMGMLIHRIHRKKLDVSWRKWSMLVFWSVFTHPLLDYFTTYGTGAFLPFSNYRVELGTIGIVDVFYTLPFLIALLIIPFINRNALIRRRIILGTVYLTSFYLLGTVANKIQVNSVFKKAFAQEEISYQRFKSSAMPLSNFLWMGIAETDSGYYMGWYSNFDAKIPDDFTFIPRNETKLDAMANNADVEKLIRFTKGYYHVSEDGNGLFLADLRFGKMGTSINADYIFKFYIKNEDKQVSITQSTKARSMSEKDFKDFINRIKGI